MVSLSEDPVVHRLFIDDILIFCNGSLRDAMSLKELLDMRCSETRMEIEE